MTTPHRFLSSAIASLALLGGLAAADGAAAVCSVDPCASTPGGSAVFDCDQDGYNDREECGGITAAGGAAFDYPSCRVSPTSAPNCLDPKVPDVFVRLEKDTAAVGGSAFDQLGIAPGSEFLYVTQPVSQGGLPLQLHQLSPATPLLSSPQPNGVTSVQAAIIVREVRENLAFPCPIVDALGRVNSPGSANEGNNFNVAIVYSTRILRYVDCVYLSVGNTSTSRTPAQIAQLRHTAAHELTHLMEAAPESNVRFGGQHYKSGSGCVLDQSTQATTKGSSVTFFIPTKYCGPDVNLVTTGSGASGKAFCSDTSDVLDGDGFSSAVCLPLTP
jgi:hypothetical protein